MQSVTMSLVQLASLHSLTDLCARRPFFFVAYLFIVCLLLMSTMVQSAACSCISSNSTAQTR